MKVGILGVGEVGSAIRKLVRTRHQIFVKDLDRDEIKNQKINFLHVCIPYTSRFVSIVKANIKEINPQLVIIESTVAVGTVRKIFEKTKVPIAHSPLRGMHPNLLKGLRTFVKFIGPISPLIGKKVAKYYQDLGLKTKICHSPEETELAKLLDTTYYAWNIVFCKEVKKLCNQYKVDFKTVYTGFNQTYNQGYQKLGKPFVARPILKPVPGGFGGHCLYENAKILKSQLGKKFQTIIKPILKIGKKNAECSRN